MRPNRIHVSRKLLIVAATVLSTPMRGARAQNIDGPYDVTGPNYSVHVERVIPLMHNRKQLYSVSLQYQVKDADWIRIEPIGLVAGAGALVFLSADSSIHIKSRSGDAIIADVPLHQTVAQMGDGKADLPESDEFPKSYREGEMNEEGAFLKSAMGAFERHFPRGFEAVYRDPLHTYTTTYNTLGLLPGTRSQCRWSAELSFAYGSAKDHFHLRVLGQEKPSHDYWGDVISPECRTAIDEASSALLEAIRKGK